jgi:hypothetical protein
MISAWENDRQLPDLIYRRLLQHVFDLPAAALGFPADDDGCRRQPGPAKDHSRQIVKPASGSVACAECCPYHQSSAGYRAR